MFILINTTHIKVPNAKPIKKRYQVQIHIN